MVITQGRVVEEGPVATVMHEPEHPYTRLLLDSVPRPDPDRRWTDRIEVHESGGSGEPELDVADLPEDLTVR